MSAISSKYHIKIGDFGFILAKMPRANRHFYTREEAPHFVNKFSSGEPNYRDSTFFPHWVQLNWLNGFNQEFFDDGGKFYKSSGVNPTEALQLTLQNAFNQIGVLSAGAKVTAQENYRTSTGTDTAGLYSLSLNGSSQYAYLADNAALSITGDLTLQCWAKFTSIAATVALISKYLTTGDQRSYMLDFVAGSPNTLRFTMSPDGTVASYKYVNVNYTPTINTWIHIAVVYTASLGKAEFFINGASIGSATGLGTSIFNSTADLEVGSYAAGVGNFFNGLIDDVRIYNIARTEAQIAADYTTEIIGTETGLVGYWKFNNDLKGVIAGQDLTGVASPTFSSDVGMTASAGSSFSYLELLGTSDGKIYSWDGDATITELFDTRRLEWYETGTDANKVIGDTGGTETAQSQGFQVDAACEMKAVQVYLKKATGTPGAITVRIETDSTNKPSGTLVNDSATATIPAFTTSTYGWITVEFPAAFALAATTTYHIVLKTAAADNDNNYNWASDDSSPSYTAGAMSASTDGGSTWSAVSGSDAYFRILGNATSVNTMLFSSLGASAKTYIGIGNQNGVVNGDARLYSYDGTTFTLVKIFNTTNESSINAMIEFGSTTTTAYLGFGHKAKIYTTTDWSTFTLTKTISVPNNPGYILSMVEYNHKLYVGGGYPEKLPGNDYQYGGFLASFDEYSWENVGNFEHTVITCMDVYDNLMFIGTISKRLYVFNTSSIDKLFEFPWDVQMTGMIKYDDKLAISLAPTPGASISGNEGIYIFDRNGLHNAFAITNVSWYSMLVFNNKLIGGGDDGYIYKTVPKTYVATGWLQTSYDEAQLPSIDKIRRDITLMYDSLPTGCTIKVEYKTDEADATWVTLGTASTVGDKLSTFNFENGVYSKKITFKITLTTSVTANTPKLKKLIHKYVLSPDFGYLWKMKLLCSDDLIWLDDTEPQGILNANVSAGATSITLKSTDKAIPTEGFPDPNGSTAYATIFDDAGNADVFSYTGKTNTTLTGIPATGSYALIAHDAGETVKMTGGNLHQIILDLKQSKNLFTFTDIDGLTHTVLFNSYQEDNFVINTEDYYGGLENEVPITLLEA